MPSLKPELEVPARVVSAEQVVEVLSRQERTVKASATYR